MVSDVTHGVGMPELEAVLFDMDGTLVDSEKVWDVGLRELARRYGGELSAPARTRMIGTSMAESMEHPPAGVTSARRAGCVVVAVPCEVALTDPAGVIMVDSLELLDVPTLRGFIAGQAAA